jgi:hypothetical protein
MAALVLIGENGQDQIAYDLAAGTTTFIGSGVAGSNGIPIARPGVSPIHCRIDVRGNALWITNETDKGTLVNEGSIKTAQLRDGDIIRIGGAKLRFVTCPPPHLLQKELRRTIPSASSLEDETMHAPRIAAPASVKELPRSPPPSRVSPNLQTHGATVPASEAQGNPVRLLEQARLELAGIVQEDGHVANPVGQNILLRELQTLQKNITAAAEALKNPAAGIGPYEVGVELGRLCDATLKDPKWALHTVVGTDRCRSRVAKVLRTVEGIAELLKREAQGAGAIQMSTGDQDQPLSLAIEKGTLSAVERYLVSGGDPNLRLDANSLPLHKAIRYGHANIAVLLIVDFRTFRPA